MPQLRATAAPTHIVLVCFPIIFVGELPDKTMFVSLVMATRGRPVQVWLGAALAFVAHVAIAVTVDAALFSLLSPARPSPAARPRTAGGKTGRPGPRHLAGCVSAHLQRYARAA